VDWDGDGHKDLLVGDFGTIRRRIRTLTDEQQQAKAELEKRMHALNEEAMPLWNSDSALTETQREALADVEARLNDLYDEAAQYEEFDYESHGWVWLYRQIGENSTHDASLDPAR